MGISNVTDAINNALDFSLDKGKVAEVAADKVTEALGSLEQVIQRNMGRVTDSTPQTAAPQALFKLKRDAGKDIESAIEDLVDTLINNIKKGQTEANRLKDLESQNRKEQQKFESRFGRTRGRNRRSDFLGEPDLSGVEVVPVQDQLAALNETTANVQAISESLRTFANAVNEGASFTQEELEESFGAIADTLDSVNQDLDGAFDELGRTRIRRRRLAPPRS